MGGNSRARLAGRHGQDARRSVGAALIIVTVMAGTVAVSGAMWVTTRAGSGAAAGQHPGQLARNPRASRLPAAVRTAAGRAAVEVADRRLSAELTRRVRRHAGRVAVGVLDRSAGTMAVYGPRRQFFTASIVKADILAALLLRSQRQRSAAAPLGAYERALAVQMMERSDNVAATRLWALAGGAAGIARANAWLGLAHTRPQPFGAWGLTTTTVADQLRLLADLIGPSALSPASRSFELALMRHVEPGQAWGVPAAAGPGSRPAVKDGWLRFPQLWIVNSMGVVRSGGHLLCLVVLADGQPTEAAGIHQVRAAALAAARVVTDGSRGGEEAGDDG